MSQNEAFIGSMEYPLPYTDEQGNIKLLSNNNIYVRLPVLLEGTPEEVQARVTGTMWRHLPTRGRLTSFLTDLRRRSNNIDSDQSVQNAFKHRRRAKLTLGQPGSGKTHKARTLGKMVSEKGAIYVNCKDLDLKSLIVQTVLDTSNIDVEKNAIDARIKMYNKGDKTAISADGITLLKQMFESAFTTDAEGRISLDWSAARNNTVFTSADRDKEFITLLQQFCKREHIECTQSVNNIGFVEKDGKLIEALESGRPIILDEINRGKNQDFLLPYLDFFNGSYDTMDIEAANGRVIHLSKEDIPDTFMLEAIGNPETLEMGIKEKMSEPLKDRFDVEYTEDYTAKDFTDMFCAYATGVPIAIIADAFDIKTDAELSQTCKFLRTLGLTKAEKDAIPEDQKLYLENAGQFLAAAEIVGRSLYELYEFKKSCNDSNNCEDPKLRQHIKETPFSFRLIEDIFNRMKTYMPKKGDRLKGNPFLNYAFTMPSGRDTLNMRMERQGEAIEVALKEVTKEIFSCDEADAKLSAPVLGFANNILAKNGVGEGEELFEARAIGESRLKTLFTFSSKQKVSEEALKLQEIICDMIKEAHPEKDGMSNDEVMDATFIESFMADIRENVPEEHFVIGKIMSVNTSANSNNKKPFIETSVVEAYGLGMVVDEEHLVEDKAFLATLIVDDLSENNLKTIWPKMFGPLQVAQSDNPSALDVLSGKSEDVLYNAFVFKNADGEKVVLDIVHVPGSNPKTLIVGESELDKVTAVRLKKKGITYLNRNDGKTKESIDRFVYDLSSEVEQNLLDAVHLRNGNMVDNTAISKELMRSFKNRSDANNLAQVSTYFPSELSVSGQGNEPDKTAQAGDVFGVLTKLQVLDGVKTLR